MQKKKNDSNVNKKNCLGSNGFFYKSASSIKSRSSIVPPTVRVFGTQTFLATGCCEEN